MTPKAPAVPNSMPIAQAMRNSAPLENLWRRVQDSNARFSVVRPHLPAALVPHVKAGPLDAEGWTLLAANAAVGAKLRQLQPRLQEVLRQAGWAPSAVRVKVSSDSTR